MSRPPLRRVARWVPLSLVPCVVILAPTSGHTAPPGELPPPEPLAGQEPTPLTTADKTPRGTPRIHLDRLDFPDVPGAAGYKKHLLKVLHKEARRARWGAGRDNRIEYRFEVTELSVRVEGDVLRVSCSAVGRLPGRQTARSRLTFGGDPAQRTQVVHQVLEIVARGVLTRLSELERQRRGLP
ncbi:MAG: hypothetical protein GX607_17200 [Myxococcales bacterium]|jgi:hypothetical protein|nr:hypothetical protein [Myxococcales bacterium]